MASNTRVVGGIAALVGLGVFAYLFWPRRASASALEPAMLSTSPVPSPKTSPTDQYIAQVKSALTQKAIGSGLAIAGSGAASLFGGGTAAVGGGAAAATTVPVATATVAAGGATTAAGGGTVASMGLAAAVPIAVGVAAAVGLTLGMREVGYLITKGWGLTQADVQAERDRWFAANPGAPYRPEPLIVWTNTYQGFLAFKDAQKWVAVPRDTNVWYQSPVPGTSGGPPIYSAGQVLTDFVKAGFDGVAVQNWLDARWAEEVNQQDLGYSWGDWTSLGTAVRNSTPIQSASTATLADVLARAAAARYADSHPTQQTISV